MGSKKNRPKPSAKKLRQKAKARRQRRAARRAKRWPARTTGDTGPRSSPLFPQTWHGEPLAALNLLCLGRFPFDFRQS